MIKIVQSRSNHLYFKMMNSVDKKNMKYYSSEVNFKHIVLHKTIEISGTSSRPSAFIDRAWRENNTPILKV